VVNEEVRGLPELIAGAVSILRRGGRVAAISYHSLEDRAVKKAFRSLAERCTCPRELPVCGCGKENLLRIVTRKAVRPTTGEVTANPRSRSARLRVAERL
jgi:16S rRNA (cytosine1402-N4)-methyltransferase